MHLWCDVEVMGVVPVQGYLEEKPVTELSFVHPLLLHLAVNNHLFILNCLLYSIPGKETFK